MRTYDVPLTLIIEEEKRRREQEESERPTLQLPLPLEPPPYWDDASNESDTPKRGVVIIDLTLGNVIEL